MDLSVSLEGVSGGYERIKLGLLFRIGLSLKATLPAITHPIKTILPNIAYTSSADKRHQAFFTSLPRYKPKYHSQS